jgi:hypothetical protein
VHVHLSVVQIGKCDYYSGRHVCVHVPFNEVCTCFSNVCFITVQTSQFIYSCGLEFVMVMVIIY